MKRGERIGITIEHFYNTAKRHAKMYNPYGVTCQAIQETSEPGQGPFKSELAVKHNNFGGIKCKRFWLQAGRDCTFLVSDEEIDGKKAPVRSSFRVYRNLDDYLECLNDKFLEPGTNYQVVVKEKNCFWLHFAGLYFGGWATDSGYFAALCDHAVALAPRLLGPKGPEHIRTAFAYALTKNILQQWMVKEIKRALEGRKRK